MDWIEFHNFIKKEGEVAKDVYYSLTLGIVSSILRPNKTIILDGLVYHKITTSPFGAEIKLSD